MADVIRFDDDEVEQSQLPALVLLQKLGFTYLPQAKALELRGGKERGILLEPVLTKALQRINQITYKGVQRGFSESSIAKAVQKLKDVSLMQGQQRANELVYDLLTLGESFDETIEGDTKAFSLKYIDWKDWKNNDFHVTAEFSVTRSGRADTFRCDIVLFVNGIPLGVIENKARDKELKEAVVQFRDYQRAEGIPELFKYVQVVLGMKGNDANYATAGTPAKFWSKWKAEAGAEEEVVGYIRRPLTNDQRKDVFTDFKAYESRYFKRNPTDREPTVQDTTVYGLLRPEKLLRMVRRYVVFDAGLKKIARYQQVRAVEKALARLTVPDADGKRLGGVIGHTQGSGKSLTMVMLAKSIADDPKIVNERVILVTDRKDLDKQIKGTFEACGIEVTRATTGKDLKEKIESGKSWVITSVINKFTTALKQAKFSDPSGNIFVLVDEGHRSQYGPMHSRVRLVFPNACYIAFTGTPLLKSEKSTFEKFGGSIDVYSIRQATADGAVVPLRYEGRLVEQEVQRDPLDVWFERYSRGLSNEQKADLKKKWSRADVLPQTQPFVRLVAWDVYDHFKRNWKATGFKAMLVAARKETAILFKEYMEHFAGMDSKDPISTEVLISAPDDREDEDAPDESANKRVQTFWKQKMQEHGDDESYNDSVIERFKNSDDIDILIVVSKLLTGFDAPKATVLYLAKTLKDHTLLQAIARVNRLEKGKQFGLIVDYMGNLGHLNEALGVYTALEGFEADDVRDAVLDVREEIAKLPQRHAALLNVFKDCPNKNDSESLERWLADEARREDFKDRLREFGKNLHLALSTQVFFNEVPEETIQAYQRDLKKFVKLRGAAALRYQEKVDFKQLEPQIKKLLDEYVDAKDVVNLTRKEVDILDQAEVEQALDELSTPAAKADMIASATKKRIEADLQDRDPVLYERFSRMLEAVIEAFRTKVLTDLEYLDKVKEVRDTFEAGADDEIPGVLKPKEVAQAYFRVLDQWASSVGLDDEASVVALTLDVEQAIESEYRVDWVKKEDVKNRMRNNIDDAFFQFCKEHDIEPDYDAIDELTETILNIAAKRRP